MTARRANGEEARRGRACGAGSGRGLTELGRKSVQSARRRAEGPRSVRTFLLTVHLRVCSTPPLSQAVTPPWSGKDSGKGCLAGAQAGGFVGPPGTPAPPTAGTRRGGSARASGSDGAESLPEAGARRRSPRRD